MKIVVMSRCIRLKNETMFAVCIYIPQILMLQLPRDNLLSHLAKIALDNATDENVFTKKYLSEVNAIIAQKLIDFIDNCKRYRAIDCMIKDMGVPLYLSYPASFRERPGSHPRNRSRR